jgi:LysM repeat protein
MKQIRFSPWLILVLAVVLVFAAGCERPDPQVVIATPQPDQPQQPQSLGTPQPGVEATPTLPLVIATADLGAATPSAEVAPGAETAPGTEATPVSPDSGQPQLQETPQVVPTVVPPGAPQTPQILPTAPAPGSKVVHTVKPGETLFSIGRQYNVNPYAIAAANNIPYPYIIYPGQQLTIPTGTTPPGPNPTPVPPQPGACRYYHKVLPGENLFRISTAYGVPMSTIAAANGIVNYNLIYAGQTLCIP